MHDVPTTTQIVGERTYTGRQSLRVMKKQNFRHCRYLPAGNSICNPMLP
jgi:hypothetical protein